MKPEEQIEDLTKPDENLSRLEIESLHRECVGQLGRATLLMDSIAEDPTTIKVDNGVPHRALVTGLANDIRRMSTDLREFETRIQAYGQHLDPMQGLLIHSDLQSWSEQFLLLMDNTHRQYTALKEDRLPQSPEGAGVAIIRSMLTQSAANRTANTNKPKRAK